MYTTVKHVGPDPFDIIVGIYLWGCVGWLLVGLIMLGLLALTSPERKDLIKFQARQVLFFPLWPLLLVRNLWRWGRALAKIAFP